MPFYRLYSSVEYSSAFKDVSVLSKPATNGVSNYISELKKKEKKKENHLFMLDF